jgi:hypothetical protein
MAFGLPHEPTTPTVGGIWPAFGRAMVILGLQG